MQARYETLDHLTRDELEAAQGGELTRLQQVRADAGGRMDVRVRHSVRMLGRCPPSVKPSQAMDYPAATVTLLPLGGRRALDPEVRPAYVPLRP
jgi:hypothetical protein